MIKAKAFLVAGETKIYNGQPVRDLASKVEKTVQDFVGLVDEIVDVKINTQITGVSGDYAFILILYKGEIKAPTPVVVKQVAKEEVEEEVKEVKHKRR